MNTNIRFLEFGKKSCLTDTDLYLYISGQGEVEKIRSIEAHLKKCSSCRQDLADLLEILHPDNEQFKMETAELSRAELDQTIATIQEISRKERSGQKSFSHRFQWPIAIAAVIGVITFGLWSFKYFYEARKSESFFIQARTILEQTYTGTSSSNLRLTLPFKATSTDRSIPGSESLRKAENYFFQALAFRENMIEAHLGLGCIYLDESKYDQARNEFQKVLNVRKENTQALIGRGIAQHEQAVLGTDPVTRNTLLLGALNDFDTVLKLNPDSSEARYNKIWTLFESGKHKEALQEIEIYLSRDSGSDWAEGLKRLKVKIKATQISAVKEEVIRSARERDRIALEELARQAPYQMPPAIMAAMRHSLDMEQDPAAHVRPNSEDWLWAAQTMESVYRESTGDAGFKAFLDFYNGLSPPQRALKRELDRKFQDLDKLYKNSKFAAVLDSSKPLVIQYINLKDFWHLAELYHIRGNSFYLGNADFHAADAEYRKMLEIADRIHSIDLTAMALGSLATTQGMQRNFDNSLRYAGSLKVLAQSHNLTLWYVYACNILGNQLHRAGQLEQSLHEYSAALGTAYRLLDGTIIIYNLESLGEVLDRLGRIQEAGNFYRLALQQYDDFIKSGVLKDASENVIRRPNLLFKQGKLALRSNDLPSAESLFQESLKSTSTGMHELKGRNYIGLAEIYLSTNRIREAETMLESAMAIGTSKQYPEIIWQTAFIKGRLLERTGHHQPALQSIRQAIEILEHIRGNIRLEDLRRSFLTDRFDPFKAMVSLLYKSAENKNEALEFINRAKSITLREHLKLPSINSPSPQNPKQINSYPIVEYFFTNDELLIFLTRQGYSEAVIQNITTEEISRQIREFLDNIRRNDSKAYCIMARRLYDELIAPIEKHAFNNPSETVVILPDGPLHLLPFAGLQDQQGRFVLEKTSIAFAPSRSVFQHCLSLKREKTIGNNIAALIDGSAGLPNARDELLCLSSIYGNNASILSPKDVSQFKQAVTHSGIIHFSGHAVNIQSRPALLLQTSPKEIYLDCQTINTWNISNTYLVNLAGCSTGIGPLSEGEAPWGLIPAFLNAGSPAIIASLLPVDDASTRRLNCQFYELLKKGSNKAQALQRAQLALLNSVRSRSDVKPQSWTPYVLIGNPQ
jgi:CHAT domain-containing protein/thioredoxin-like negative regulator of GroEL